MSARLSPPPPTAFSAVVPAAGFGLRMGSRKPLLPLDGLPILHHALRRLRMAQGCAEVVLAVHPCDARELAQSKEELGIAQVVPGGANRQESVLNALQATRPDIPLVLIHDAVRPLVRAAVIEDVARAAAARGAAIAASPAVATIKEVGTDRTVCATPPRERLWMEQTPQGFARELALQAHRKAQEDGFIGTDDASLVERLGHDVVVVEDRPDNIKITTPQDLAIAEAILDCQRREGLPEAL
jgi:2-C-methyl-D-erythritol 4-phosphate cytidylyltransferase